MRKVWLGLISKDRCWGRNFELEVEVLQAFQLEGDLWVMREQMGRACDEFGEERDSTEVSSDCGNSGGVCGLAVADVG